jgi:hypothetical protein
VEKPTFVSASILDHVSEQASKLINISVIYPQAAFAGLLLNRIPSLEILAPLVWDGEQVLTVL